MRPCPPRHQMARCTAGGANALLVLPLVVLLAGCAVSLPNLRPFADHTASLALAVGATYDSAENLMVLARTPESSASQVRRVGDLTASTFRGCAAYADALAILADEGRSGKAAVLSVAESLGDLLTIAGGSPVQGEVASSIAEINQYVAAVRARSSLADAITAAQPAVDTIAAIAGENLAALASLCDAAALEAERQLFADAQITLNYHHSLTRERSRADEMLTLLLDHHAGMDDALDVAITRDPQLASMSKASLQRTLEHRQTYWLARAQSLQSELDRIEPSRSDYLRNSSVIDSLRTAITNDIRKARGAISSWARAHKRLGRALSEGRAASTLEFAASVRVLDDASHGRGIR